MNSVKAWATRQGFDYHFIDDELFQYAPAWYRERVNNDILLTSDLARLEIARQLLSRGYSRTIWIDADVLIFNPDAFRVEINEEYAFSREIWVGLNQMAGIPVRNQASESFEMAFDIRINNSVSVFVEGNGILDFYIHSCKSLVKHADPRSINRLAVGTAFLTRLNALVRLPLVNGAGLLSPLVMKEVLEGRGKATKLLSLLQYGPMCAANLCGSLCGTTISHLSLTSDVFDAVIEVLLLTKGDVINSD